MTGLALHTAPGTSLPGKATLALTALCSLLLLVAVWALLTGPMTLQVNDIFASVWRTLQGESLAGSADWVVRELRLPRVVLAMLVGAGLAVAGCVTQGVFRNPLADPGLIGVSSGASAGASFVIVLGAGLIGGHELLGVSIVAIGAFLGAVAATFLVYRLAASATGTSVAFVDAATVSGRGRRR